MRSKMKIKKTVVESLVCLSMILSMASCAGDGFDEETFSAGVTGTQLLSPEASGIAFAKIAGSTNVNVTWPLVFGAGGYQFSMYVVDDPANPVAVVKDSIIDGCSVACPYEADTNYKVEIRTLGNEKYNNADAATASEATWSTLVAATKIPAGTDLVTYFTENPITTGKDVEVAFELEAGGSYTISGDLDFGVNNVQLRGNKVSHAKIQFTGGSAGLVTCGGGLTLKFIDFDCDAVVGGSFLKFGTVPEEIVGMNSYGIVTNPIMMQSCHIKNVKHYFININGKKYAVQNLIIRDCVVELYQDAEIVYFNSNSSFVKDLEISSSTFYSHLQSGKRFIQYSGGRGDQAGWSGCSMKFKSNTFYNIAYSGQSFNSNSWAREGNSVELSKNIFFDSCSGEFNRRIRMQSTKVSASFDNNCYWYKDAFPKATEVDRPEGDKSTSAYGVNPEFANPEQGDFTPRNAEVISHGSGDPRWL